MSVGDLTIDAPSGVPCCKKAAPLAHGQWKPMGDYKHTVKRRASSAAIPTADDEGDDAAEPMETSRMQKYMTRCKR